MRNLIISIQLIRLFSIIPKVKLLTDTDLINSQLAFKKFDRQTKQIKNRKRCVIE